MNTFISDVLTKLIGINIFAELIEHIRNQCVDTNHRNHLLCIIVQLYCKIKLTDYIQITDISDRHSYNKILLSKGQ